MSITALLLGALIGVSLAYYFLYSPKARVERLWKEILVVAQKIGELKKSSDTSYDDPVVTIYEGVISKKKKMVAALLEYHFDREKDEKFRKENKP